jgi:hypothetical protein
MHRTAGRCIVNNDIILLEDILKLMQVTRFYGLDSSVLTFHLDRLKEYPEGFQNPVNANQDNSEFNLDAVINESRELIQQAIKEP